MIEIKIPEMGESITEATIASWLKQAGDNVTIDEPIAELETDKATVEVAAAESGILQNIQKQAGDTVTVNEVIAYIQPGSGSSNQENTDSQNENKKNESGKTPQSQGTPARDPMPAAQKMMQDQSIPSDQIQGTGKQGQILKEDVQNYASQVNQKEKQNSNDNNNNNIQQTAPMDRTNTSEMANEPLEQIVPMTRLRQTIARRLVEAQTNAAILTTFNEIDMSHTMQLRSKYKEFFKDKYEVGLGFMSFFAKAAVLALKEFPAVNAEIRDNDIVYKNYYHLGVAVGGPKGLVVPVVRNADQLSFAQIEAEIIRLALAVRKGNISLNELQGGTFSITNGGIYGSMMSTPILNPPQSGILGMHNIVKRAVVVNDEIVVRPMMYVAMSYDHRIVDGKEAVSFLVRIKQAIEDPARMLLEV